MKKRELKQLFDQRADDLRRISVDVYNAIYRDGNQGISEGNIYAAKSISGLASYEDMFKSDDSIREGITNISNGKPANNEPMLVYGISLQSADAGGTTDAHVKAASFGLITDVMRNGEIEISQNKRTILARQSMESFCIADHVMAVGDSNAAAETPVDYTMKGFGHVGFVELAVPKWVMPNEKLDVNLKFTAPVAANTAFRVILHGIKNVKG